MSHFCKSHERAARERDGLSCVLFPDQRRRGAGPDVSAECAPREFIDAVIAPASVGSLREQNYSLDSPGKEKTDFAFRWREERGAAKYGRDFGIMSVNLRPRSGKSFLERAQQF